jgi:hypothetical protein
MFESVFLNNKIDILEKIIKYIFKKYFENILYTLILNCYQ